MSNIDQHISIPKDVATQDDLDFFFLREEGIKYISELGQKLWTDYNSHDPGITILEMLSYAISDLGMRINMPIEDLLTSEDPSLGLGGQFFKPLDIFPSKPVTALDYRKLFIDLPGVKNCWLGTYKKETYLDCKTDELFYDKTRYDGLTDDLRRKFTLKGLYTILVDFDDDVANKNTTIEQIRKRYHENRNLCEDLITIEEVQTQSISVCATIEVENQANEEYIHAQILVAINTYFSPSLSFQSIKGMMDKGYTVDQIFDGPTLDNGFIDTNELEAAALRTEVRLSDIMKLIMNIDGVKFIKDIAIGNCGEDFKDENEWLICMEGNRKPVLCDKSVLNYSKGFLPLNINQKEVEGFLEEFKEAKEVFPNEDIPLPKGSYFENDAYTTIQNDFPDTYGIGPNGLSARATPQRKAQAKQLKGYLLFFDKILASYFSHLGKVKDILSVSGEVNSTFFTQAIKDVKGLGELVNDYETTDDDALTQKIYREFDNNVERRNQVLDHLLSRFAERFGEYTFLMKTLYGSATGEVVLRSKEAFLKDYKIISQERGNAFNYYKQLNKKLWRTNNVSGTQKRIARLLGIKNYNRRNLSSSLATIAQDETETECRALKWEIKNRNDVVLLEGIKTHITTSSASKDMYLAVLKVIESDLYLLENALSKPITANTEVSNFLIIKKPDKASYAFRIINPDVDASSPEYIIAKHPKFYRTQESLKKAMYRVINFIENDFTEEGLFLIEHILLRPDVTKTTRNQGNFIPVCADSCENCEPIDPYSYKVSIILPGYTNRFADADFRNYMEQVIKEELPAHILARICWVGHRNPYANLEEDEPSEGEAIIVPVEVSGPVKDQLPEVIKAKVTKDAVVSEKPKEEAVEPVKLPVSADTLEKEAKQEMEMKNNGLLMLEEAYKAFLIKKTKNTGAEEVFNLKDDDGNRTSATKNFIEALFGLQTLYPGGRLVDCEDDDDSDGKIILGRSNIGSL